MKKPFAYLEGMEAAPDAPIMDNPSRLYCPSCRAQDRMVCDDPGFCGNLRPMRPIPEEEVKPVPSMRPTLQLDNSRGQLPLKTREPAQSRSRPARGRHEGPGHAFDRLMGRKTTITQGPVIDGEEKSWDWFMENVQRDIDILNGEKE